MKFLKRLFIIAICLSTTPVMAQSIDLLIDQYRRAVAGGDSTKILMTSQALKANPVAVNYIKANDTDLYMRLQSQVPEAQPVESTETLVATAPKVVPTKKVENQPLSSPSGSLANYDRVLKDAKDYNKKLHAELEKKAIIMTIAGVPKTDRQDLLKTLQRQLRKHVKWLMEENFDNGQALYWFELKNKDKLQDFAYSIDDKVFGKYELDLMNYSPQKLDYILKLH